MSLRRATLALVLVPLLAVMLMGCSKKKSTTSTSPTTAPAAQATTTGSTGASPTSTTASGPAAANSDIAKIIQAFTTVKSFRATITTEGQATAVQGALEYVAPDKLHITFNDPTLGAFEIINIGTASYTKIAGTWTKSTAPGGPIFDPKTLQTDVNDLAGYTKGASATVNGKSCQLYTKADQELCIGGDNLPARIVSGAAGSKVTIVFTDYNANITINAPI